MFQSTFHRTNKKRIIKMIRKLTRSSNHPPFQIRLTSKSHKALDLDNKNNSDLNSLEMGDGWMFLFYLAFLLSESDWYDFQALVVLSKSLFNGYIIFVFLLLFSSFCFLLCSTLRIENLYRTQQCTLWLLSSFGQ